mmetsp:Transcript_6911/g.17553  ORF Transcript_6911/g.17553 Transcript_6911/m.17553 type:complete len:393 (-) Transcript_6911:283-1461(-)
MATAAPCISAQTLLRQADGATTSAAAHLADLATFNNMNSAAAQLAAGSDSLHVEAGRGNLPAVLHLLDSGLANVNERDSGGRTPLHLAAISGSQALMLELLRRGADADAVDKQGKSPLHWAVAAGDLLAVEALSRRPDVDVNRAFCSGETSLHIAVYLEHVETVDLLISHSADCCSIDRQGRTPLHVAATVGNVVIIQKLLAKGSCGFRPDRTGRTALHCACAKGKADAVTALVSSGANVEVYDKSGITPLYIAAFKGHKEAVAALLERHNANIEAIDLHRGSTALHAAAAMGHIEVVQLLLRRGANWQAKTKHGQRPVDLALEAGHTDVVQLLQLAPPPPRTTRSPAIKTGMRKRIDSHERTGLPGARAMAPSLVLSPKKPRPGVTNFPTV